MPQSHTFIVIVGATSAIAEHCARQWLQQRPVRLLLMGRNQERTDSIATDLRIRSPLSRIETMVGDFESAASITSLVKAATAQEVPDMVLIAHGALPDQQACQQDLTQAQAAIRVNAISPVLFAEAFVDGMERAGKGTLGIIGSVAGDRGRKSNYVYGAAKGLVERYAEGLQHRLAATGVKVVLIKPGPTDTPMTAQLKSMGTPLADPAAVARAIVRGMARGRPVVYAPAKWALVMLLLRHLPRFVFHRLNI
ncbi:SDR family NAD(P)-dependent oxidoreductase [Rhodoferax saidenbachensis]|uniref:Short-chain dehydrogenase n=1 Tax=Rhodoferax saidenbachensis TaxID=1484693 RepID=A0A1P8KED9_9BURK|nr:SDR family NAD(P)-dependent oxidoreductase [Rhodoferax saidenbachensis]APW44336.1 short-chain dehydrogenase [Rhodoferax saidenbachensis]